jgi:transcriptional regulator with XRE-family HTH domain
MKLAEVRRSRLMSLRDLERKSGVTSKTINSVELGHTTPSLSTIRRLVDALDVDPMEVNEFRDVIRGKETALTSL